MLRKRKLQIITLISIFFIILLIKLLYPFFYQVYHWNEFLQTKAEELLQKKVEVGRIKLNFLNGLGVQLDNISIREMETEKKILSLDRLVFTLQITPLVFKKIIFKDITMFHPILNIEKYGKDKFNFDKTLILSYLNQKKELSSAPPVEIKRIAVERGRINFTSHSSTCLPAKLTLDNIGVNLKKKTQSKIFSLTVRGDIPGEKITNFHFSGKLKKLPWDLNFSRNDISENKISIKSLNPSSLPDFLNKSFPFKQIDGLIDITYHQQGPPGNEFKSEGEAVFSDLKLNFPPFFKPSLPPSSGKLLFKIDYQDESLKIKDLSLFWNEITWRGHCRIDELLTPSNRKITLTAETSSSISWEKIKGYLPSLPLSADLSRSFNKSILRGLITHFNIRYEDKLEDFRQLTGFSKNNSIIARLQFRDLALNIFDPLEPIHNLKGSLRFENEKIHISLIKGNYRNSKLLRGEGTVLHLFNSPVVYLSLGIDLDLEDLRSISTSRKKPANRFHSFLQGMKNIEGKAALDLNITKKVTGKSALFYKGKLNIYKAALSHPLLKLPLSQLAGQFKFETNGLDIIKLTGIWGESPFLIQGKIGTPHIFPYLQLTGTSDKLRVKDLISSLPFLNKYWGRGLISGKIEIAGLAKTIEHLKFKGELALNNTDIKYLPSGSEIQNLTGIITFNERSVVFNPVQAYFDDFFFETRGTLENFSKPVISFVLNLPYLDIAKIIPPQEINRGFFYKKAFEVMTTSKIYSCLIKNDLFKKSSITGNITIDFGKVLCFDFFDLKAEVNSKDAVFVFTKKYQAQGGFFNEKERVELTDDDMVKFHLLNQMDKIDLSKPPKHCPNLTGISNIILTGSLNQTLILEGGVKLTNEIKPYLNGKATIKISRGRVKKFNVLGKIFSILNISQLLKLKLPDLTSQGMPFERLGGDCIIKDGILETNDFILDGDAIKIAGVGKIGLINGELDLRLGVQPLQTIDKIISIFPLVGEIITGEDKSLIVAYFDVTGDTKNPKVTPSPLTSLKAGTLDIFMQLLLLPKKIIPLKKKTDPPGK